MAAYAILPPQDPNYGAVKDALRPYSYDPDRARTLLRDLGWTPGPDGILRNSADGRRFRNAMIATIDTSRELPPYADYWRRIGLEVEEQTVPASQTRNLEFRASFPGWAFSAKSPGDGILGQIEGPAASPQTRWVGNRDGYEDPRAQVLIERYRASLSPRDQFTAMKEISDLVATELPFLPIYRTADSVGVRAGIKAYDDHMGGTIGGNPYGTYARNSHLWDIQ
jgi:peptide/nickel transport system substrate-binding protein